MQAKGPKTLRIKWGWLNLDSWVIAKLILWIDIFSASCRTVRLDIYVGSVIPKFKFEFKNSAMYANSLVDKDETIDAQR